MNISLAVVLLSTAATEKPIYPLLEKPTKAKIQAQLAQSGSGFEVMDADGVGAIELGSDGLFSYSGGHCECSRSRYQVATGEISGSCRASCAIGWNTEKSQPANYQTEDFSFSFKVSHVSDGLLLLVGRDGTSCWKRGVLASCGWLVEIIPGAADAALFEAAKAKLRTPGDTAPPYTLFAGPKAKTPRAKSEVFFADGGEQAAAAIAQLLAPIIGQVEPKPWPGGSWQYSVVVVVGSEK